MPRAPNDEDDAGEDDRREPAVEEEEVGHERARLLVEVWTKSVDAQLHFAALTARSRQLGLIIVGAALVVALLLLGGGERWMFRLGIGSKVLAIHAGVLVLLAGSVALALLRMIDLQGHDRMLRGALSFGEDLEEHHLKRELVRGVSKGLTQAIAHFARYPQAATKIEGRRMRYIGDTEVATGDRGRRFYGVGIGLPAVAALLLLLVSNLARPVVDESVAAGALTTVVTPEPRAAPTTPAPVSPTRAVPKEAPAGKSGSETKAKEEAKAPGDATKVTPKEDPAKPKEEAKPAATPAPPPPQAKPAEAAAAKPKEEPKAKEGEEEEPE